MTNKNINTLTGATTPLAGTETLPVWDGATKKVATNDLTVRNVRANATTGIMQITGPAAASTRVATVPDANWTAARTDAAQTFTGDQTLLTNLVQGTAAKGINFTANTPAAGMTSQLLNWYEEGTWTPNQGAGLTVIGTFGSDGTYTRIGRTVTLYGHLSASTSVAVAFASAIVSNLPYAASGNVTGTHLTSTPSGGVVWILGSTVYSITAISAAANIWFSFTYQI